MAGKCKLRFAQGVLGFTSIGLMSAAPTLAAPNLVLNGDFENNGGVGQIGSVSSLSSWTRTIISDPESGGLAFVVDGSADSNGFPWNDGSSSDTYGIWGPGTFPTASNNGFTGSPNGGYFLGISPAYGNSKISQIISGLTVGQDYTLTFEYAGSQLSCCGGSTDQAWQFSFGSQTGSASTMNVSSRGFDGWNTYTTQVFASSSSTALEFTPNSASTDGPFLLLDGVSLTDNSAPGPTPVPGPLPLMGAGAAFAWSRRLRRRIKGMK
jgi:MYXO-CTERM domain-containing protein